MKHTVLGSGGFLMTILASLPAAAQNQAWVVQFGSQASDVLIDAAPDASGGVYVGGNTDGSLGAPNSGFMDAWFARYDGEGNRLWIRQLGSTDADYMDAAAADGSGGVFVSGWTSGNLGGPSAGGEDVWLARYDSAGNQIWVQQFGTGSSDFAFSAAPDGAGGVYVGGLTHGQLGAAVLGGGDCWISRFDSAGSRLWTRQFGTSSYDTLAAAAADGAGGVCVGGTTNGSLSGSNAGLSDAWVARFDSLGNQVWVRQLGTSADDRMTSAAQDMSGGAYVSGITKGSLHGPHAGDEDAWVARYDGAGNQTWGRQLGTTAVDRALACTLDGSGGVYVGGDTKGSLGGPSAGKSDVWLTRHDAAGALVWIRQTGTNQDEFAFATAPGGLAGAYLCGLTMGSFGGLPSGLGDAWLSQYDSMSTYCAAKLNSLGCLPAIVVSGSPSATAGSGFLIRCANVRNFKAGLLFYGVDGRSALPFQGGTLCVGAPIKRTGATNSGGTPLPASDCSGVYTIDMNQFAASTGPPLPLPALRVAGTLVHCQWWGRDPGFAPPNNATLSDGLRFVVGP